MTTPSKSKSAVCGAVLFAALSFAGCGSKPAPVVSETQEKQGKQSKPGLTSYSEEITSPVHGFTVKAGTVYMLAARVKNTGTDPWMTAPSASMVEVGYRWRDQAGTVLPMEGNRAVLSRPILPPGASETFSLKIDAPATPGSYTLWVSMVEEGVAWFFDKGAKPLALQVTVN